MQEPEFDNEDPDTESMFDFLGEEGEDKRGQKKSSQPSAQRELPIIRKPVPISESGPLLPPKRGAPVEPPPELTGSKAASGNDDMSFLEGAGNRVRASKSTRPSSRSSRSSRSAGRAAVEPVKQPQRAAPAKRSPDNVTHLRKPGSPVTLSADKFDNEFDDFRLDLDDGLSFDSDWRAGHVSADEPDFERKRGGYRWLAYGVGIVFVGGGVAAFVLADRFGFTNPLLDPLDATIESVADTSLDQGGIAIDESPLLVEFQESPSMTRFKAQIADLEALVQAGSLDEADQFLATMDRTDYGYGTAEFDSLQTRINGIRSGEILPGAPTDADAEKLRLEQEALAAQTEAARLEQVRVAELAAQAEAAQLEQARAAELAAQAEAARVEQARASELAAQAEAARVEQARAAELAAQAEAARVEQARAAELAAQTEAARVEQARAAELAAQTEAARTAEQSALTFAARQEQARVAERAAQTAAARLAQAREEELSESARAEAARLATDRRIAEDRAALQRQEARELRLQQARDQQLAAERQELETRAAVRPIEREAIATESAVVIVPAENTVAAAILPVSDDDLQLVYRRFADLQKAIRDRDINTVVSLTQRSSGRVQDLLQMFQNSVDIDARIRNVSTNNATGEINGTLQIEKIQRADGSVSAPPPSLASIRLSSKREAAGWSAIRW